MYAGHTGPCEPENLYEFLKMSQKGSFLDFSWFREGQWCETC